MSQKAYNMRQTLFDFIGNYGKYPLDGECKWSIKKELIENNRHINSL